MPLHANAQALVDRLKEAGGGKVRTDWSVPAEVRNELNRKAFSGPDHIGEAVGRITDIKLPMTWGEMPVRIYYPKTDIPGDTEKGAGLVPGFLFIHGGGFCMGSIEQYDELCRKLVNTLGRVTVSFEYRLAPKYRHPSHIEDCISISQWLFDNAASLGIDRSHIAIGGDSAGGCLTTTTCMYFRDRNGVRFEKQIMAYPCTDFTFPLTKSMIENEEHTHLNFEAVMWCNMQYLSPDIDLNAPYLFPNRQKNLKDLPPCFILTGEYDVLRDEAEHYGEMLKKAGNDCRVKRYEGMTHTFLLNYKQFDKALEALEDIREFCRTD